jgi:hypothetical protein
MSFLATTGGISGDDVRDLMVAAVEHRFGRVNRLPATIEWLSDNGSCYIAGDTRRFARDIGLEPRTTPIESPQSNGMAEASSARSNVVTSASARDRMPRPCCVSCRRGSHTTMRFIRTRLSVIVHPVSSLQLTKDLDRVRSFGSYNTRPCGLSSIQARRSMWRRWRSSISSSNTALMSNAAVAALFSAVSNLLSGSQAVIEPLGN